MASPISETPILIGEDAENFYRNKAKVEEGQNTPKKQEERRRIMANYAKVTQFSTVDRD